MRGIPFGASCLVGTHKYAAAEVNDACSFVGAHKYEAAVVYDTSSLVSAYKDVAAESNSTCRHASYRGELFWQFPAAQDELLWQFPAALTLQ